MDLSRTLGRPDLSSLPTDLADLPDAPASPEHRVVTYLGRSEVAMYLGLKGLRSLTNVVLPPHDAQIGDRKGWLPETIDAWRATRPGRGRWGAR